jgi:hypothetical protein
MSTVVKILIGFVAFILITGISFTGCFVSINNSCITFEKQIEAQYKKNQNVYDNFWKTVKEVAQVPDKFKDDTIKLYQGIMSGRYGKNGSKAMFQFLKEQNPMLDASLYKQVQQAIEAGRNDFKNNQTILIDLKAQYEMYKGKFPTSFVASMMGFPKIDLKKFDIVTSDETDKAFETKKSAPVKVW